MIVLFWHSSSAFFWVNCDNIWFIFCQFYVIISLHGFALKFTVVACYAVITDNETISHIMGKGIFKKKKEN